MSWREERRDASRAGRRRRARSVAQDGSLAFFPPFPLPTSFTAPPRSTTEPLSPSPTTSISSNILICIAELFIERAHRARMMLPTLEVLGAGEGGMSDRRQAGREALVRAGVSAVERARRSHGRGSGVKAQLGAGPAARLALGAVLCDPGRDPASYNESSDPPPGLETARLPSRPARKGPDCRAAPLLLAALVLSRAERRPTERLKEYWKYSFEPLHTPTTILRVLKVFTCASERISAKPSSRDSDSPINRIFKELEAILRVLTRLLQQAHASTATKVGEQLPCRLQCCRRIGRVVRFWHDDLLQTCRKRRESFESFAEVR